MQYILFFETRLLLMITVMSNKHQFNVLFLISITLKVLLSQKKLISRNVQFC